MMEWDKGVRGAVESSLVLQPNTKDLASDVENLPESLSGARRSECG